MRNRLLMGLVLSALGATAFGEPAKQPQKPSRPIAAIDHVVIISVDGLRPDALLLANTPVMHDMAHRGAYTFWAKTTAVSITLPSHVSMLTGVIPSKHKIEWNVTLPLKEPFYPLVPTIFEMAKAAGYTTAMVAGKPKFDVLAKPGTVDYAFVPESEAKTDQTVCDKAVEVIARLKPDVLFVHLPATDEVGHASGWGSHEQLAAIEQADAGIGRIVAAVAEAGLSSSTFMIVTADHGGQGLTHGPDDARSRHIPWLATGPGVKPFFDLTQVAGLEVRTEDTCATACWLLGLPLPEYFDGKPVYAAFADRK